MSNGGQYGVILILKKGLYVQVKATRHWYEKFKLPVRSQFVAIKLYPYLLVSRTYIFVVCDCLFWARSQSYIDKFMRSFKEGGPSYNREHLKVQSVYEFIVIEIKT